MLPKPTADPTAAIITPKVEEKVVLFDVDMIESVIRYQFKYNYLFQFTLSGFCLTKSPHWAFLLLVVRLGLSCPRSSPRGSV